MQWLRQLFGSSKKTAPLYFYSTLEKGSKEFTREGASKFVRMYNCGPTVYDRQHIGNLSAAVFADTIRRVLEHNGFPVKQVINITDFGHLVSDADDGEDKMTKGLKREKKALTMENMREFATKYMNLYLEDIAALNVETSKIQFPRASDYVPAMIAMIKTLEEKGYAYTIADGVYFDTTHFPSYGGLGGISDHQEAGARVAINQEKRSQHDFALWKSVGARSKLGWDSPWGRGFPGWHLECSAMIHSLLGDQIDIHTGGIEHVSIHHNNEIAQSEAATGKRPMSRFWLHREHIRMGNAKLAKSTGNTAYLSDLSEKNIHPLSLRYWFLTAHYRQPANFTWDALEAAQKAYLRLYEKYQSVRSSEHTKAPSAFSEEFTRHLNNDLDTPGAIAYLWHWLSEEHTSEEIRAALEIADTALGLGFLKTDDLIVRLTSAPAEISLESLPQEVQTLIAKREAARTSKDWPTSDALRDEISAAGYTIKDSAAGMSIFKK